MLINHQVMNFMNSGKSKKRTRYWLKWGIGLFVCALLLWFRQPVWAFMHILGDRTAVIAYLEQFGVAGPLLLMLILVLQVVVAAIPGHALMIGGGYVYGFATAFWINLIATVGGSQGAFFLARWAGRPVVERLAPAEVLDKWNDVSIKKGLLFFLISFMIPVFPADVMNYVAGLSALSGRRFFVANLLGRLPGVVLMTAIGAYGFKLSGPVWLGILLVSGVIFAIWRLGFASKQKGF